MRSLLKWIAGIVGVVVVLGGLGYGAAPAHAGAFLSRAAGEGLSQAALGAGGAAAGSGLSAQARGVGFCVLAAGPRAGQPRIDTLERSDDVLSKPRFRVAMMQIAALADNGHTTTSSDPDAYPLYLPVRVAMFSDGVYVMYAKS